MKHYFFKFCMAVFAVGVMAGIGGLILSIILHTIQHLAYGYSLHEWLGHESFLQGISTTTPVRIVCAMSLCGLIAGVGWWYLAHFAQKRVSIIEAINTPSKPMPFLSTLSHVLLQVITVGLGSPLGREVAPREWGSLFSSWLVFLARFKKEDSRLLIASGAGAGLAAVYLVPISGVMFTLEVLLKRFQWRSALIALITSLIAVGLVSSVLGWQAQYHLSSMNFSWELMAFAIWCGIAMSILASCFQIFTKKVNKAVNHSKLNIIFCFINFIGIGVLAIFLPAILGNGKAIAQLNFAYHLSLLTVIALLIVKVIIVLTSLRVGAYGGLLTPSIAIGALLGTLFGYFDNMLFSTEFNTAYALIAAASFLAISQRMPLTAIFLIMELTHADLNLLWPISLSVLAAFITKHFFFKTN